MIWVKAFVVDLVVLAALVAEADRQQRRQGVCGAGLGGDGISSACVPAAAPPGARRSTTGKNATSLERDAWVGRVEEMAITSLAPSGSGAVFGMASPAMTGMKARPFGPAGTGKATKSSGSLRTASTSRATWSQATQTSPGGVAPA